VARLKERALDRAIELFWRLGYEATSIAALTEAMGINPPSLYAAFGDKRTLFTEAVERYQRHNGAFAARALAEEAPPAPRSNASCGRPPPSTPRPNIRGAA
jgi:AcrR family transcriptional regulator